MAADEGSDVAEEPVRSTAPTVSRRSLLAAGGVGLAIGAVGVEIGNLVAGSSSATTSEDPPDVDLMQEHGVLKRVLLIYQEAISRTSSGEPLPLAAVHGGAQIIHEFIEGFHEALEEGYVFPMLRRAGWLVETVDTLYVQHGRGRQLTQLILTDTASPSSSSGTTDRVVSSLTAFVRMYQPHEAREDTVVFPAFRGMLSTDQANQLAVTFANLQRDQFGPDGFEKTVAKVAAIEQTLGIYDLDQFTPDTSTP